MQGLIIIASQGRGQTILGMNDISPTAETGVDNAGNDTSPMAETGVVTNAPLPTPTRRRRTKHKVRSTDHVTPSPDKGLSIKSGVNYIIAYRRQRRRHRDCTTTNACTGHRY